jgi:hypothetical protein
MYSKKDQTKKNKDKEVLKDTQYLNHLKSMTLNCVVCGSDKTELHHVYSVLHRIKRSDRRVIPLCQEHHTGNKCSPHGGRKEFESILTLEDQIVLAMKLYDLYIDNIN